MLVKGFRLVSPVSLRGWYMCVLSCAGLPPADPNNTEQNLMSDDGQTFNSLLYPSLSFNPLLLASVVSK